MLRPYVKGKFLFIGSEKFYVRGVTYGTFRPTADGHEYPEPTIVARDFALMAANGFNAIRTYTVPPRWLLDIAESCGLYVMVGMPLERYIGHFASRKDAQKVKELVRTSLQACLGHSAVLCYALGNELPTSVVRWYGRRRIERYFKRLYLLAKSIDPSSLITYVNYPSTEYLQLSFLDLVCYNVYLEQQRDFAAYLARLQNIADNRPLLMSEMGLDSMRNSEAGQAQSLDWQIRSAAVAGCAGSFVYAWTDEWFRGGEEVTDWAFGLTRCDRSPKPALATVHTALKETPFPPQLAWPMISVVVCSYNGSRTIATCLAALEKLDYPSYEVIMVDDGSTDETATLAAKFACQVIRTTQQGLSHARNTGLKAAQGEIVAYIDDDAYPDPHWLRYLAITMLTTNHAGVGGPNIPPPNDGFMADCVANAPGSPVHVLLSDQEAEHIPGCNMAFRKACLEAIGGFDPQFRVAGDDVDICWRLQQRGWTLGFSPAAVVWHHRRQSLRTYWRQQYGYGKAEALLEAKWPEKYNVTGNLTWVGRIYDKNLTALFGRSARIYHGIWGSAPFQALYQSPMSVLTSLPLMPEWYLLIGVLALLSLLGFVWSPLLWLLPCLVFSIAASLLQAGMGAKQANFTTVTDSSLEHLKMRVVTGFLHLLQPLARLYGRLQHGLTPWRHYPMHGFAIPWPVTKLIWCEQGQSADRWLQAVEAGLRSTGAVVLHGNDYDPWDLEVHGGALTAVRIIMAVEEHGGGKQLVRFRIWPQCAPIWWGTLLATTLLTVGAAYDQVWLLAALFGGVTFMLLYHMLQECGAATAAIQRVLRQDIGQAITVIRSLQPMS